MTDKLHYQDVFRTINIPQSEKDLAFEAKYLFDIAYGVKPRSADVPNYLRKTPYSDSASQAFWSLEDDNHLYDRLALTIMQNRLTIGLQHRDFDNRNTPIRTSLTMSDGRYDSELAIVDFKEIFIATTANLGLYKQIKRSETHQNASSSAIFESAA